MLGDKNNNLEGKRGAIEKIQGEKEIFLKKILLILHITLKHIAQKKKKKSTGCEGKTDPLEEKKMRIPVEDRMENVSSLTPYLGLNDSAFQTH